MDSLPHLASQINPIPTEPPPYLGYWPDAEYFEPSEDDRREHAAQVERWCGPDEPERQFRDDRDLMIYLGECLAAIGLEPDLGRETIGFAYLGRDKAFRLEDLTAYHEHMERRHDEEMRRPGPGWADLPDQQRSDDDL